MPGFSSLGNWCGGCKREGAIGVDCLGDSGLENLNTARGNSWR